MYAGFMSLQVLILIKWNMYSSTVPISTRVPKPIVEVGQFLGTEDIVKVRSVLRRGQMDFLDDYYRKEQFFPEIEGGEQRRSDPKHLQKDQGAEGVAGRF